MYESISVDKDVETFEEQSVGIPWVYLTKHQRVITKLYLDIEERIQNMKAFEDDVWVATFPKSGTKWMQELVWCLRHGIGNENGKDLDARIPFLELSAVFPIEHDSVNLVFELDQPRTIKTHLSYDMLPQQVKEKAKTICVLRNPRDVCLSHFNHFVLTREYKGDLATIVNLFTKEKYEFAPYSTHVLSYWNERTKNSNLLIVTYEEMQVDLPNVVQKVAAFINAEISEEDIPKLCNHLHVDNMRNNPLVNEEDLFKERAERMNYTGTFIHKGKTGRWKEKLDDNMINQLKEWEETWLKDTDLRFVYEI